MSHNRSFSTVANTEQLRAIKHGKGPLLIIAGPGSGKTFTIVERIVYLISHEKVAPESLFVVTFTEKAAQELITRVSNRLLQLNIRININEMYLGTFHSIFLRILEKYRDATSLKRSYSLMDQFDQQYFLYRNLAEYRKLPGADEILGTKKNWWLQSASLMKWLNKAIEEALIPEELLQATDSAVQALGYCLKLYFQQLEENNTLDFSSIQYKTLQLFQEHPEILNMIREKLTYLMVDEYQDTNTIQETILTLLCSDQPNLGVVGDDDQGLYRFRGASIRNILTFKEKFSKEQCQQVTLNTNYRSHPEIIRFYNEWMGRQEWQVKKYSYRLEKDIQPNKDVAYPDTAAVVKVSAEGTSEWHEEVYSFLMALKDDGTISDWNQVAFLFRSVKNDKVVGLAKSLEQRGIPIYSPRSNMFFDRHEVRLVIGALIFMFPQFPDIRKWTKDAHLTIWDYYDNECFGLFAEELRKPENRDLLRWVRSMASSHYALTGNADYAFTGLFYQLLQFPLFSRYLDESNGEELMDLRPARNLSMFSRLLAKFEYLHNISVLNPKYLESNIKVFFNTFLRFLHNGGIDEYEDQSEYAPSGCVSFLTIHQSKGLEFPVVVVGSLEAVPRKQHTDLDMVLENEYLRRESFEPIEHTKFFDFWRLYYTAFSRAQNLLVLTCAEKSGRGRSPSRYFQPEYDQLPSWRDKAFDHTKLTLETVKDVNLKQEYSFTSHLSLFENCAQQYRFFRYLEFAPIRKSPILFGTLVHQTIEDIHKTVLRQETEKLSQEQIEDWFNLNYHLLTKREHAYLAPVGKAIALDHVIRYYNRQNGDWSNILEAEVDISLVKDEYILKGSVDLITGDNETVEIVDFKSEKKPDMEKDRDRLKRYQRQLEVYAHLVEEQTGQKVTKTHLYYTSEANGNPYITFQKDDTAIDRTINTFDKAVHRIETRDFAIPKRPEKLCEDCDMRAYCNRKNWN